MAVTIRKAAAVEPAPATTLQALLDEQATKFDQPKEVFYCVHSKHNSPYKGVGNVYYDQRRENVAYSERMTVITRDVFHHMQTAAFAGKGEVTLTIPSGSEPSPAITVAVLEFLRDRMGLHMPNCQWPDIRSTSSHSTFCELLSKSLDLTISWDNRNPYLNPKPLLMLPVPEVFGAEKLNEERLASKGDFTLVFGEHSFNVHRLFVQSFSPLTHSMLNSGMKETSAESLEFPEVTYCSKEALDALLTMMYLGKMDLKALPPGAAVELLELGSFLLSNPLMGVALTHLYEVGPELAPHDILNLSFLQTKQPSENLKQICDWLMRIKPQFYEELLNQDTVSTEELFRLFAVSVDFKIDPLKERLEKEWDKLSTAAKTAFVERSFSGGDHLHILKKTEKFCKGALKTIDPKDADRLGFVKAYKMLNDRVFELRTK